MPSGTIDEFKKPMTGWFRWLAPPWPLAWHLGALVASVALPAILLGAFLLKQQHQAELAIIERDAMARAEAMSHATDAAILGIISTLKVIGANPSLRSDEFEDFVSQSNARFSNTGIVVTLLDEKFMPIKSTQDIKIYRILTDGDGLFAQKALKTHKPQISNHSLGGEHEDHVVRVWVPIELIAQGQFLLEAMIPTIFFNHALLDNQLPFGWSAGTSDRNDRIIARTDDYERFVGKLISEDTRRNTIGPAGIMRSIDLIGRPTMQAYLHSGLTGWRMSTWAPTELLESRARENWTNFMLMGGALTAFAALSAWLWASGMTASVLELAESAKRLESDRLLDKVSTPVLEVNKLRDTISVAAAELIRRKAVLAENEERLRLALGAGDMGVWEWDPETDACLWDATQYNLTGFTPDETPATGTTFMSHVHPDDQKRIKAALSRAEETGEAYAEEFRFLRPDGSLRWLAGRGRMSRDNYGAHKRFVGVNFDITDQREHAARTRALLLEVSHRSKNLLAVILAMGRLTARDATTVNAYERALRLRIGALAASQDLIVASDWQGVGLEALVLGQLRAVVNDKADRTVASGPAVTLNPTAAQNLGMAFAELALNALDHGALSTDRGKVKVSWTVGPSGRTDEIYLSWIEHEGPPVEAAKKRGYGLAVVERLVSQSLKAKAEIQFAAEGVQWSLVAPLHTIAMQSGDAEAASLIGSNPPE